MSTANSPFSPKLSPAESEKVHEQRIIKQHTKLIKNADPSELRHNEEEDGQVYKYDLPVENRPIEFRHMTQIVDMDAIEKTPVQNLYEELELDKDSSYE